MKTYDSTVDTLKHKARVAQLLNYVASELLRRAMVHDDSKLQSPEKELFDKYTPLLTNVTYGSEKYHQYLAELKPALDHHYENNSHHPEHYQTGVDEMDLLDIVEMFVDWIAASERHEDGSILRSIEYNRKRFGLSDQIANIFKASIRFQGDSKII